MVTETPGLDARVTDLERRLRALEQRIQGVPPASLQADKPDSIREFLNSKSPTTFGDKALVVAYFLEKYDSVSPFSLEDLSTGFAKAKEPLPTNPSDLMYQNVRKGFLMESREKKGSSKSWVVTNSGEQRVEHELGEKAH